MIHDYHAGLGADDAKDQARTLSAWGAALDDMWTAAEKGLPGAHSSTRSMVESLQPLLERFGAPDLVELAGAIQTGERDEIGDLVPALIERLKVVVGEVSPQTSTVLLVDDADRRITHLQKVLAGPGRRVRAVSSAADAEEIIKVDPPDVVLVRLGRNDRERRALLIDLLSHPERVVGPKIVVTLKTDRALRAEAFALGADAVLELPADAEISSTVIAALLRRHSMLARMAQEDPLTSLPNRAAVSRIFIGLQSLARRNAEPLTLCLLDVDLLKKVNDQLGHAAGDILLRQLARTVTDELRQSDVLARWGGDEFVLLLPRTPVQGAGEAIDKFRNSFGQSLRRRAEFRAADFTPDFSTGIIAVRYDESLEVSVMRADRLLYRAKASSRHRVVIEETSGSSIGGHKVRDGP